jgi:uncharacterized membrane protein YdjX (TVP38/TMEM64 family)
MKLKRIDRKSKIKFIILIIIILTIGILAFIFAPLILEKLKDPQAIKEYLLSFGGFGFLVYILILALHVIVVVIPGDIINVCGGYIYGIPLGFLLSFIGIMIGTVTAFYISRIFGYDFVIKFISEEKISKLSNLLNSTKGMMGMLVICLIPVIPKDLMIYVAGLTPIKASRLFIIYGISRIPGTLIWVSVGANVNEGNVLGIVITLIFLSILISIGLIIQHKFKFKKTKGVD